MKYIQYQNEKYYPILKDGELLVFYRNLLFSCVPGMKPVILYTDFGPLEAMNVPSLPAGFIELLGTVATENQGDLISAMLTVCAGRTFATDDFDAKAEWAGSVDMMIASLSQNRYHCSIGGFYEGEDENATITLTDIIESHCSESEHTYQEEEIAMSTTENNTDILSMEELLKLAEEAPTADETSVMPDDVVPSSEAMPIADAAVDAIVADMLGGATSEETPVVPEEPVTMEEPIIPEEPVATDEPVIPEEPVMMEEPAIPEEPVAMEEPVIPEEPVAMEEPAEVQEEVPFIPDIPDVPDESSVMEETVPAEEAVIPEEPLAMEEPVIPEEPVATEEPTMMEDIIPDIPEDPMAMAEAAPICDTSGNPMLITMNENSAHCVLCVRPDPETLVLPIESGSAVMISDDTLIYPEGETLVTQNLLTGEKEASPLNESVLAAFSISMERFATENEAYTKRSLLFPWLLKNLANGASDPEAAEKINDYLSFIGCTIQFAGSGFTDAGGNTMTVAEVFRRLSERKI